MLTNQLPSGINSSFSSSAQDPVARCGGERGRGGGPDHHSGRRRHKLEVSGKTGVTPNMVYEKHPLGPFQKCLIGVPDRPYLVYPNHGENNEQILVAKQKDESSVILLYGW